MSDPSSSAAPSSNSSNSSSSSSSSTASASASSKKPLHPWAQTALRWARDLVVMALLVVLGREAMAELRAPGVPMNEPAPATTATTFAGERFALSELRGRPVLVNFWASWCGPCRAELPDLKDAAVRHPELAFVGLAVSSTDRDETRRLVAQHGLPYPTHFVDAASEARWNISSVPSTVLLDAEGRVVWRRSGGVDVDDIEGALAKLR